MQSARTLENGKWGEISRGGNWRINVLALLAFLAFALVIFRLFSLQVVNYSSYRAIAENQREISREILPKRGQIYLANGNESYPVAVNREWLMAYAVPKEIADPESAARHVAEMLGLDGKQVAEKFKDRNDVYEVLKHRLGEDEVDSVRRAQISGIHLLPESFRFYPAGELASQVIGFVGSDGQAESGRYGVEAYWEEELRGRAGSLSQEGDSRGRWISIADRELDPAEDGDDLVLTLDYNIQYEVEKILQEAVEKHQADGGGAIVMEPKTGRILAMANAPDFNLNNFGQVEDISVFANPLVSGTYECGSVFKTITAAIGIDDGKIDPDTTFTDTGAVREAGYLIQNSDEKSYGLQTMTEMLEKSLNTGAIFVQQQVGNKNFADYVERFGFGEKTGVHLLGEASGNIRNLEYLKRNINFFTASFGQGISVTPLQLVNAYAAIANRGKLMRPQIVREIIHSDGRREERAPEEIRRVIQEESARQVGKMLRSVVVNGHGKRADVPGYLVGGKTGTAQVAKSGAKGYEEGVTIGSFVGFAPIDDPQYVVLVKIDNPKDVEWAESTAAPAFGRIMKFLLEYGQVEPTEEIDLHKLNQEAAINLRPDKPAEVKVQRDSREEND